MKDLPIVWQRLVNAAGSTCPRCAGTGDEVYRAVERLAGALQPLGVRPTLEVRELDLAAFAAQPSESNRIWVAGRPLESWVGGSAGSSRCCNECGDNDCRTLEVDGQSFEVIPSELLIRAGLVAASTLLDESSTTAVVSGVSRSRSPIVKRVQIFDPAMCCSTGVCGPEVDQELVRFAADAAWAGEQGLQIERLNLAQQPLAFAENPLVKAVLQTSGEQALPLTLVDGVIRCGGRYPTRTELADWAGKATLASIPIKESTSTGCCGPASKPSPGGRCC